MAIIHYHLKAMKSSIIGSAFGIALVILENVRKKTKKTIIFPPEVILHSILLL